MYIYIYICSIIQIAFFNIYRYMYYLSNGKSTSSAAPVCSGRLRDPTGTVNGAILLSQVAQPGGHGWLKFKVNFSDTLGIPGYLNEC